MIVDNRKGLAVYSVLSFFSLSDFRDTVVFVTDQGIDIIAVYVKFRLCVKIFNMLTIPA